ncbi:hypothetical protein LTR62_001351 [Meristemomyces frigidus]|uniref:Small ribosomal subunit protein mS29 n=1 Tax=Meristemomyces frigidus TaxID=1508187 RepID=A0AAN7YL42_9PEZI|nr:hypothetical protein LTR62_001351 [Meristemomyces frigidus]
MPSTICLRCLKRTLPPIDTTCSLSITHRAAFSTTPSLSAQPVKKKASVKTGPQAKAGKTLRLAKNKPVQAGRPPAAGERKALRKRIVLSNTNALEVQGLENLTTDNAADAGKLQSLEGHVLGFGNDTVEALRALEAFKPGQGWGLFRRPAALVRRETVELGEALEGVMGSTNVTRQMIYGERGSGKSVLLLQGMAMAYLQGWIVIHLPEAREITNAQTSYQPYRTPEGETIYIQPHYTAQLLLSISKANRGLLSNLRISEKHDLPMPLQSNISLARLVDLGANDPSLAYPIWRALWAELTSPSQPEVEGQFRPPVFVSMDGVDHIMRPSAYLNSETKPIHAHELAVARDYSNLLSGKTSLPNGGMIMAATSASTRPSVPTLDHVLARKVAERQLQNILSICEDLKHQAESAKATQDLDITALEAIRSHNFESPLVAKQVSNFRDRIQRLCYDDRPLQDVQRALTSQEFKIPEWDPYAIIDQRVSDVMESVEVRKVEGLSKVEARGVMEYYARSGMVRAAITEGLVSEKWTLAGNGMVGELEKATVMARF